MISTAHMLTGVAIASTGASWWSIVIWSVLSHFLLDMLPHWDPDYRIWPRRQWYLAAFIDLLIGLLLVFWLMGDNLNWRIYLGILVPILPDVLSVVALKFKGIGLDWYLRFHKRIQNESKNWFGIATQVIYIIFVSYLIWLFNS